MAMSKLTLDEEHEHEQVEEKEIDLTHCGVCFRPVQNPKALPCLHTFCLSCISEWAKEDTWKVKCPVCMESFPLPKGGVAGIRSNSYVVKLKETQALKDRIMEKTIMCTFCDKPDNHAIARCLDCKEHLCDGCIEAHKTYKTLKEHKMQSFDDISSGKVDILKTSENKYCAKHEGQILWFYCETCGLLICRDCTVVDHHASTHNLVNVEDISGDQGKKLKNLVERCQKVAQEVKEKRQTAEDIEKRIDKTVDDAQDELEQAIAQVEHQFLNNLKQRQQQISDEIDQIGSKYKLPIDRKKDTLQTQHLQLERALQMTAHVMEQGSPYDLAAMYTTLTSTLQRLSEIRPCRIDTSPRGVKFAPNKSAEVRLPTFGDVIDVYEKSYVSRSVVDTQKQTNRQKQTDQQNQMPRYDLGGTWIKERHLCENADITYAINLAFYPSGEMATANYGSPQVKVFNTDGQFQRNINVKHDSAASSPRSIAIGSDGTTFVTDKSPSVKVFDSSAQLIRQFPTHPPGDSDKPSKTATLAGLAIAYDKNLVVGDVSGMYISIHKPSGAHIHSFKVDIQPWFVSTAQNRDVMIISNCGGECAKIVTCAGHVRHTLSMNPESQIAWRPTGAWFNGDGEFLIASQAGGGKSAGVCHYSTDGKFLRCITTDVEFPTDVAVTKDGKLLVLEWKHVKVFRKM
ncbi:uncharacterized protein [Amphiura filiformis]|uniref:uncharacterized protein n=1 Tax=Amphiura filiformis TaxID=82378 RepID=UPI003B2264CC